MNQELAKNGFLLLKDFFNRDEITKIHLEAKKIFFLQFSKLGIETTSDVINNDEVFNQHLFDFFADNNQAFINSGKQIQHLISLHQLATSEKVVSKLTEIGLDFPNICTRPVLFFNHPKLAKEDVYHTVFAHQDWRSMQGSLDSLVIWLPLVDIDTSLGALQIIPGSHKMGLVTSEVDHGFGKVEISDELNAKFQSVEVEIGDALIFSSFLIHQSGFNTSNKIRWSAHFRYNNLMEQTFIQREYAHPYLYKPVADLLTPDFPKENDIQNTFK